MDPLTVYALPTQPWSTDFGDGIFEGVLPTGYTPSVSRQPARGTVEIFGTTGWRFVALATPEVAEGNVPDSWEWTATDGSNTAGPFVVEVELTNAL